MSKIGILAFKIYVLRQIFVSIIGSCPLGLTLFLTALIRTHLSFVPFKWNQLFTSKISLYLCQSCRVCATRAGADFSVFEFKVRILCQQLVEYRRFIT